MTGLIILAVFIVVGATVVIAIGKCIDADTKAKELEIEYKLKQADIERQTQIANRALDNDILRVKINDISTYAPRNKKSEFPNDQIGIYEKGYSDGAEAVKAEAKKIVMCTRTRY